VGNARREEDPAERASFPSGYGIREAARLLGLSAHQIQSYVRAGFLSPRRGDRGGFRFSFQDLILLRTAKELSSHLPPRRVRRALERLRSQLPRGKALSAMRITAEGEEIVVRDGRTAWNPTSGQTLLDFEVSELASEVAPLVRRAAEEAREPGVRLEADDWYELGCDLEHSDPEQARDAYRRCLEIDPLQVDAHINLGRLLHEDGEVAPAEIHYRIALMGRSEDVTAAYNLGVSLQDLGRFEEAIRAYEQAIANDPECADAHYNLAQVCEALGRRQRALRHLQIYRDLTA
jgi:tetratricopeptide (TPR) repeat protein